MAGRVGGVFETLSLVQQLWVGFCISQTSVAECSYSVDLFFLLKKYCKVNN